MQLLGSRYIDHLWNTGKMPEKDWDKLHHEEKLQLEKLFIIHHALEEPVVYLKPRNI